MPTGFGSYECRNLSPLYAALDVHFRKRGVTSERKRSELSYRWIRQKGERMPQ